MIMHIGSYHLYSLADTNREKFHHSDSKKKLSKLLQKGNANDIKLLQKGNANDIKKPVCIYITS